MSLNFSPQIVSPDAPFSDTQRAWLNRLFAEALLQDAPTPAPPPAPPAEDESTPWHDPAMGIDERMTLAAARPVRWKLMAAMAQQDCGQCGSSCADYSQAIFEQAARHGVQVRHLRPSVPTLEDVFAKAVGEG